MRFEWDAAKASSNEAKHGVGFAEACTVFADPLSATAHDPDHSVNEHRWLTFGRSNIGRVLVVSYAERGSAVRIISARVVSRHERKIYEEG